MLATVRNQGQIVDTFDLRVDGMPDAWWTIAPATVFLNPWGTSGDYEQQVQVRLHPPRTPESEARDWPLTVVGVALALARRGRRHGARDADRPAVPEHGHARRPGAPPRPPARQLRRRRRQPRQQPDGDRDPGQGLRGPLPGRRRLPARDGAGRRVRRRGRAGRRAAPADLRAPDRPSPRHHAPRDRRRVRPGAAAGDVPPAPWLPWWVPPVPALLAAFTVAILLLRRDPEVPKLEGDTVEEAVVVLEEEPPQARSHDVRQRAEGRPVGTIIRQEPAAGDAVVKGESVNVTLAAPPQSPARPAAERAHARRGRRHARRRALRLQPATGQRGERLGRHPPGPRPGHQAGARDARSRSRSRIPPRPRRPPPPPTPRRPRRRPRPRRPSRRRPPRRAPRRRRRSRAEGEGGRDGRARRPLPKDFVFAGATSGQLYRWASADAKAARLTSPKYRLETPAKTDDGYVAVHVADDARRLVRISADGKTVAPIAEGDFHRPAYSPSRGLLAVISADGKGAPPTRASSACWSRWSRGRSRAHAPPAGASAGPRGHRTAARCSSSPPAATAATTSCSAISAHGGDASGWDAPTRSTARPESSPRRGSETTASPSCSPTARAPRRTCGCSPAARTAA